MLVNIHHDSAKEHNRLLVAGIAFLVTIALLVYLSIAIYNKDFARVTTVTIKADRAGLQLAKFGDVRFNGALVGQVRSIGQDGEEAEITIALEPDAAKAIPANIEVEILPTTLFGQKYLLLKRPADPSSDSHRGRRRHPGRPGQHQRRAEPDPRRPVPVAPRRATRRPQRDAQRAGDRARRPRRADRPDHGRARRLPRGHRRPPPDAAPGPDRPRRGRGRLRPRRSRPARHPRQRDGHQPDHHREGRGPRRVLRRPRRSRAHVDPDPARQRAEHDRVRPGDRAGARAAAHLLARVPLPAQGCGGLRADPLQDVRGQRRQAVHGARQRPVPPLRRGRPHGVRRGRARTVVPRPAEVQGPRRPGSSRQRQRHRREPADQHPPQLRRAARHQPHQRLRRLARATRRSSTRCSRPAPAGSRRSTAPSGRCSTARSCGRGRGAG